MLCGYGEAQAWAAFEVELGYGLGEPTSGSVGIRVSASAYRVHFWRDYE